MAIFELPSKQLSFIPHHFFPQYTKPFYYFVVSLSIKLMSNVTKGDGFEYILAMKRTKQLSINVHYAT
jgi:hypothetical protein